MGRFGGVNKTGRLSAIDGFNKITVDECIFDIQLMNRP
jgi:hypothetical protein